MSPSAARPPLTTRVRQLAAETRLVAETMWRTRTAFRLKPATLKVMVAHQRLGHSGPSLLYRLNAASIPNKLAAVSRRSRLTFGELDQRIDRLAYGLRERHGIRRGDAVVLLMSNCTEILELQAAMARLGGGAVTLSWRSTPSELEYLVAHSGARAVFVEDAVAESLVAARPRLDTVPERNFFMLGQAQPGFVPYEDALGPAGVHVADTRDAGEVVIYTSGTTGRPKGAVRRFPKETVYDVLRFIAETPMRSDDRHLVVCPMYHSTAFGFLNFTFIVGGTLVIEHEFDPEGFLAAIERDRITTTAVVPTMLHRVLELPRAVRRKYNTRSLRAVFSNAAPLSGTLARRFIEEFGPVLYNCYGATEIGLVTIATPDELLAAPGTIGHVVPGTELRLVNDEGCDVGVNKTGELFARNALLVAGYHRDDDATRNSMLEGFFSVGDLAHIDDRGLLHIDGRKRDMIITGGVNVYPVEVEEALQRHEAVAEAAVIGVPDAEWGERVRAYVTLRAGASATEVELVAFMRREVSRTKVPREIRIADSLPKNSTGKILKRELRD